MVSPRTPQNVNRAACGGSPRRGRTLLRQNPSFSSRPPSQGRRGNSRNPWIPGIGYRKSLILERNPPTGYLPISTEWVRVSTVCAFPSTCPIIGFFIPFLIFSLYKQREREREEGHISKVLSTESGHCLFFNPRKKSPKKPKRWISVDALLLRIQALTWFSTFIHGSTVKNAPLPP